MPPHEYAEYQVRRADESESQAWRDVVRLSFEAVPTSAEENRPLVLEHDRSTAVFHADRMIATAAIHSFEMTVPGGPRPVAGVAMVSVLPGYRRQGLLGTLMARQLLDLHEAGAEPLAALFATEAGIYGRYGYSCAGRRLALELRAGETRFDRRVDLDPALRIVVGDPQEHVATMTVLHDRCLDQRPGTIRRTPELWKRYLADIAFQAPGQLAQCLVAGDAVGEAGYALLTIRPRWDAEFAIPAYEATVFEVVATTPATYAALWRRILDKELVTTVHAPRCALDEPLLRLLADPRRARPRLRDDLWARLVDVDRALAQRSYARAVDVVLDVVDPDCPWNQRRWRLAADDTGATCTPTAASADIRLHVRDLSADYLGGGGLSDALRAGLVAEETPGSVDVLASAMRWATQPLCTTMF